MARAGRDHELAEALWKTGWYETKTVAAFVAEPERLTPAKFQRRAAFALLARVALHDRTSGDEPFLRILPLVEKAASDERNLVKKGVSWALRSVGTRSAKLNAAAVAAFRNAFPSIEGPARIALAVRVGWGPAPSVRAGRLPLHESVEERDEP